MVKKEKKWANVLILHERIKSSRSLMFFKIGVIKNFPIFKGKHLCWSLFLIKLTAEGLSVLGAWERKGRSEIAEITNLETLWTKNGSYF